MPRPKTPIAKARLTGADGEATRTGSRTVPNPPTQGKPVGDPPAYMDKEAATAWRELARTLGWLEIEDRPAVESAAIAIGQVRTLHKAGEVVTGALLSAMNTALGKLGASPADRSKVHVTDDDEADDPFAKFH
ncbi:MAG: hypothetical protein U5K36_03405 [Roseovarius sp.]|nr:hypothetical protein [Roseovarius sp.]